MKFSHLLIEYLLQPYQQVIGEDYDKYRNHIYRVFLNCQLIDNNKDDEDKYAIAAVFHDIGIWTKHTIDYLDPSVKEAEKYLLDAGKTEWIEEITAMIYWHHKTKKYEGAFYKTTETFRKADWTDVSFGFLSYGSDRQKIKLNRKQFPNKGFHFFLVKKILKNFLRHPLNPVPMFKK